jgi:hypothetical protein
MRKRKKNAGAVHRGRPAAGPTGPAASSRTSVESILDIVSEATRQVPDRDWARLPTDLSKNADHYLYGTKKKEQLDRFLRPAK